MGTYTDTVITYCRSWFRAKKIPTDIWDGEKAKSAHANRDLYTVVLGSPPTRFIELNLKKGYVGVGFLDSRLREYMSYQFQAKAPEMLFLSMATYREFAGDSDKVKMGTTYYFKLDGNVLIETKNFETRQAEQSQRIADVQNNWEPMPEFGQYESIARIERLTTPS